MRRREWISGLLFTSPFIIGLLWFQLYPVIASGYYSLTSYNLASPPTFIGLKNYTDILSGDPLFWKSLVNTLYYTFVSVPLQIIISVLLAMLLNTKLLGRSFWRAIYFFPTVVPPVVVSVLWMALLNPQGGPINEFLALFHLPQPTWLASPNWSMPGLILVSLWGIGSTVIILLAGLQDVPKNLLEAASLDGAGTLSKFWHVILPLISPVILFNFIINLIASFQQTFTVNYIMTGGGPLNSTLMYPLYLYRNAFQNIRMGYASADGWILFIVILLLTMASLRLTRGRVHYG